MRLKRICSLRARVARRHWIAIYGYMLSLPAIRREAVDEVATRFGR